MSNETVSENGVRKRLKSNSPVEKSTETPQEIDDEEIYPQIQVESKKSLRLTYFLWFFGGVFGLHHYYLRRTQHAFVWFCTFGGFFATGWLLEFNKIPSYVKEANEDPDFVKKFRERLRSQPVPKFNVKRLFFGMFVGSFFARILKDGIPEMEVYGVDWKFLELLTPLVCAIGVWLVGNIGREQGILKHSVIAAYLTYPVKFFIEDLKSQQNTMAFCTSLAFIIFSKKWRKEPPRRKGGALKQGLIFSTCACIYLMAWGSCIVFNFKVQNQYGDEVPLYEIIKNVVRSPFWAELKQNAWASVEFAWNYGIFETWRHLQESMDMYGEMNAYKVLGLEPTCNITDVKSAFRKLSLEYHPDKVKDESQKEIAKVKYMEIREAYDLISKIKSQKKEKISLDDAFNTE